MLPTLEHVSVLNVDRSRCGAAPLSWPEPGEEVENSGATSSGANGHTLKEVERSDGDFDDEGKFHATLSLTT